MNPTLRRLTMLLSLLAGGVAAWGQALPLYVGREVCLGCHGTPAGPPACKLEPIPAHDRAYSVLDSPQAEEIAVLTGGVGSPTQDLVCLGCHAAASDVGPRWTAPTFQIAGGVQCESCHDAGSLHVQLKRRTDGDDAYSPNRIQRGERGTCKRCHTPRLSHDEVLKRGFGRAPADRRYKTPTKVLVDRDGALIVCCEHSDSVLFVDPQTGSVVREIEVGRRPGAAALSPDGRTLYVSNRLSNSVSVIDRQASKVVAQIAVGAEPHGLSTDSAGKRLFVLNTGQDSISVVDTAAQRETKRLAAGVGPWALVRDDASQRFLVTNVRPNPTGFREPHTTEISVIDEEQAIVERRLDAADANMVQGIAAVPGRRVTLFTLMRTKNLVPITRVAQGWTTTNGLGVIWPDGTIDQVLLDEPNSYFADPTDVAVSPDGRIALVAGGGVNEIAVVDIEKLLATIRDATPHDRAEVLPNHLGMSGRFVVKRIPVGANPRSVAFSPDGRRAYVANALDDTLSEIDPAKLAVVRAIKLGGPGEISEIRRGERLFHNASISFGSEFSCRSCHPDGHVDGLAFDIEADGLGMHPVDNRSLRGITDTGPFKWEGTNPTLQRQCGPRFAVFFTRLAPYKPDELDALVRYICTIERPPNPYREAAGLTLSQRRGKMIFERSVDNAGQPIPENQRCVTCHANAYRASAGKAMIGSTMWLDEPAEIDLTSFQHEEEGQVGVVHFYSERLTMASFDIAHLTGVQAGRPYLHNGGAMALEELWTRFNAFDAHGMTNDLTRRQFNDLIAYLWTL
ncbi:MAG: beta-propeller fold lactonase family protein [Planctomycetes bacterium]|nr:beta-propeller fold lactonase family protein [Planctomycetota bacterium]